MERRSDVTTLNASSYCTEVDGARMTTVERLIAGLERIAADTRYTKAERAAAARDADGFRRARSVATFGVKFGGGR